MFAVLRDFAFMFPTLIPYSAESCPLPTEHTLSIHVFYTVLHQPLAKKYLGFEYNDIFCMVLRSIMFFF